MLKKILPFTENLAKRFVQSSRLRSWCGLLVALLVTSLFSAWLLNPLQYGLIGEYYHNPDWSGEPVMIARDTLFNLWRVMHNSPDMTENYSIEWTGVIAISQPGMYQFFTHSDDGSELSIDNQLIVDNRGVHGIQERSGTISLEAGCYPFQLRYMQGSGGAAFQAFWQAPGNAMKPLSQAPLFVDTPSQRGMMVGHICETWLLFGTFLLILILIVSLFIWGKSRSILTPFFTSRFPGRQLQQLWRILLRSDVPHRAIPTISDNRLSASLSAFAGYVIISLLWTYPLVVKFSTAMFGLGGDRYIYLWDMWWMKKALLELHINPFVTDYLFYPKGVDLSFHDFTILNSLLSVPLQSLFSVEQIYNILFLASFVFAGLGCFLLVRYLTGSALAGFISGLVFAFWGGRAYSVDHLSLASVQWLPFCALYVLKTLRQPSYRNPVLAAIFLAMNALSAWYYAIYMTMFAGLFLLYHAIMDSSRVFQLAFLKRLIMLGVLFLVIMLPLLFPMLGQVAGGQDYMVSEVFAQESASLNALFFPNANHGLWGKYIQNLYARHNYPLQWGLSGGIFIGYTVIGLCLYAFLTLRHLKFGFWLVTLLIFLTLSFGPHPLLFSKVYESIPLPYQLLQHIPILKMVRIPVRFMTVVMLCCSVLAGYACWDILRRTRLKMFVFVGLSVCILLEAYREYYVHPTENVPQFYQQLESDPDEYAILEITPYFNWQHSSVRSSLFQITHGKKLFHGHVSRVSLETYHEAYLLYAIFDDLFMLPEDFSQQQHQRAEPLPYFEATIDPRLIRAILTQYNVRYVTLYADYWRGNYVDNFRRLKRIFGEPAARAPVMAVFRVKQETLSQNCIFPGLGMFPLDISPGNGMPVRQTARDADLRVLNLEGADMLTLQFEGKSMRLPEEQVEISVNGQWLRTIRVADWTSVVIPNIPLQAGDNRVHFRTLDNGDVKYGIQLRNIRIAFAE